MRVNFSKGMPQIMPKRVFAGRQNGTSSDATKRQQYDGPMGADGEMSWENVPWFDIDVPELPALHRRPRLEQQIERGTHNGLLMVCAPRGFGKTLSLSQWAHARERRPGWLTLRRGNSRSAAHVIHAITQALTSAYSEIDVAQMRQTGVVEQPATMLKALSEAIARAPIDVVLVIDNAQLLNQQTIDFLIHTRAKSAGKLHLILAGAEPLRALLSDLLVTGECSELGVRELAFTSREIAEQMLSAELGGSDEQVAAIHKYTSGWPALIQVVRNHLALGGGADSGGQGADADMSGFVAGANGIVALADAAPQTGGDGAGAVGFSQEVQHKIERYIHEVMLDGLDHDLTEFAKQATVTSRTSPQLALALTGNKDAPAHLETLYELGLFSSRMVNAKHGVVYTWHESFAGACRRRMQSRDPEVLSLLHKRAAVALATGYPVEAINHSIAAGDFEFARTLLLETWLPRLIVGHAEGLLQDAVRISEYIPRSPELLLIQACCLSLQEDVLGARILQEQAYAILGGGGSGAGLAEFGLGAGSGGVGAGAVGSGAADSDYRASLNPQTQLTIALTDLFLLDDLEGLEQAIEAAEQLLILSNPNNALHCHSLFLLGWTTLRLRTDPLRAVKFLMAAQSIAEAGRFSRLEQRIEENLFFARCFLGEFPLTVPKPLASNTTDPHTDPWNVFDGGITAVALGMMHYWQGRFHESFRVLAAADYGSVSGNGSGGGSGSGGAGAGNGTGYVGLAIVYQGLSAAVTKDPSAMAQARGLLTSLPTEELHGVPWPVYRGLVSGALHEAAGDYRSAQLSLRPVLEATNVPVSRVLSAELLRRMGRPSDAVLFLRGMDRKKMPRYTLVSAHVTSAAILWERGENERAHQHLERGLIAAAPSNIQRPFVVLDDTLRELLTQHAIWGGSHEDFLASILSKTLDPLQGSPLAGLALSERETEILGLLRTTKTAEEIAATLHISVNTVRTHQRAIYRKLGVSSRREAIRLFTSLA